MPKLFSKLFYRIAHIETKQGLWYDADGSFTGLIHGQFDFCKSSFLEMPFDNGIVGWLSATDSLSNLFEWFPEKDIRKLEPHGWMIHIYESGSYKFHSGHYVICQETSKIITHLNFC